MCCSKAVCKKSSALLCGKGAGDDKWVSGAVSGRSRVNHACRWMKWL